MIGTSLSTDWARVFRALGGVVIHQTTDMGQKMKAEDDARQHPEKAKKLALTACMRKLLTILNAIVKNRTLWRVAVNQLA